MIIWIRLYYKLNIIIWFHFDSSAVLSGQNERQFFAKQYCGGYNTYPLDVKQILVTFHFGIVFMENSVISIPLKIRIMLYKFFMRLRPFPCIITLRLKQRAYLTQSTFLVYTFTFLAQFLHSFLIVYFFSSTMHVG
jgi:hypothetical protein